MISRGDIYWWNCPVHNRPHLLNKTRPVLVVSNNACNLSSGVITVAPLTTSAKKAYPTQVPVVINGRVSIILLDKVTSIPVEELGGKMAYLKDWQMEQVDRALRVQLGLDEHNKEQNEEQNEEHSERPFAQRVNNRWNESSMKNLCNIFESEGPNMAALKFGLTESTARAYYAKFKKKLRG